MISRYLRGWSALAVATLWGIVTIAVVNASTMPPPDEPQPDATAPVEATQGEASPAPPADAPAATAQEAPPAMAETPSETEESVASSPPPPANGSRVPVEGIRRSTDVVGEVVGHPTGKVLLAVHDLVTLKFHRSEDVKPHALYAIAREEQFVEHPDTGRNMGYVVRVVATVEMEQSFGRYWSGRIVSSNDYVTLDDWIIPFESVQDTTGKAAPDLSGHIVAVRDELVLAGEANVVFTDLGSDQGVKSGDAFSIIRPGTGGRRGGPERPVGMLRILAVQPASSSAYLTKTAEPIMIGDRLEHAMPGSAAP